MGIWEGWIDQIREGGNEYMSVTGSKANIKSVNIYSDREEVVSRCQARSKATDIAHLGQDASFKKTLDRRKPMPADTAY